MGYLSNIVADAKRPRSQLGVISSQETFGVVGAEELSASQLQWRKSTRSPVSVWQMEQSIGDTPVNFESRSAHAGSSSSAIATNTPSVMLDNHDVPSDRLASPPEPTTHPLDRAELSLFRSDSAAPVSVDSNSDRSADAVRLSMDIAASSPSGTRINHDFPRDRPALAKPPIPAMDRPELSVPRSDGAVPAFVVSNSSRNADVERLPKDTIAGTPSVMRANHNVARDRPAPTPESSSHTTVRAETSLLGLTDETIERVAEREFSAMLRATHNPKESVSGLHWGSPASLLREGDGVAPQSQKSATHATNRTSSASPSLKFLQTQTTSSPKFVAANVTLHADQKASNITRQFGNATTLNLDKPTSPIGHAATKASKPQMESRSSRLRDTNVSAVAVSLLAPTPSPSTANPSGSSVDNPDRGQTALNNDAQRSVTNPHVLSMQAPTSALGLKSRSAEETRPRRNRGAMQTESVTPVVHIGRIDIIVEAPAVEPKRVFTAHPSADFASRHYLRGP